MEEIVAEQKVLLNKLLVCLLCLILLGFLLYNKVKKLEENISLFNSGETLVCYDTLIVTNSNWKLVDNHLINNNSAGYLSIDKCIKGN